MEEVLMSTANEIIGHKSIKLLGLVESSTEGHLKTYAERLGANAMLGVGMVGNSSKFDLMYYGTAILVEAIYEE